MSLLIFVLIVLGFAWYVMTPEQRTWAFGGVLSGVLRLIGRAKDEAIQRRNAPDPYYDVLCTRTRWAFVTPALVGANLVIFAMMLFGHGSLSDPDTLVRWGGNFGPRTTNGEWWRLIATAFIHSGFLALLANVVGLLQAGLVVERLVGPLSVATVYGTAAIFASLANLSGHPVSVIVGAASGVFGLYGLLVTTMAWLLVQRSPLTMPFAAAKKLLPGAAIFVGYQGLTGGLTEAPAVVGFVTGVVGGLLLGKNLANEKPPVRRIAAIAAGSLAIAVGFAIPLRGLADVRPEIEHVAAVENRIATAYETALLRFRNGRINADALADLIDRTIMPELSAARARLETLRGVPREHQQLIASAEMYLQLRDESWRLRAEGLRTTNMRALRQADQTERASLEALHKIKPVSW